ncbi:hypothetical protein ACFY3U_15955 [Micromonospora sp. NPDC000089]|uniref:hypothetical protein n=1 Tax=unclassified Micromonospora TaxID=2617518 RepID=UPI0036A9E9AD
MGRIGGPAAGPVAAVAALGAAGVVVLLAVWHPPGLPTVALALLGVLLAVVAGTAVTALRQRGGGAERGATPAEAGPAGVDADTLEALDSAAVRAGSVAPRQRDPRRPKHAGGR